jgi:hypothetical protein
MCDNFLYVFKGTPFGRAGPPAPAWLRAWALGPPREALDLLGPRRKRPGLAGNLAAGGGGPGPLP